MLFVCMQSVVQGFMSGFGNIVCNDVKLLYYQCTLNEPEYPRALVS